MNLRFEKSKLQNQLKRSGVTYEIKRKAVNSFGEPSDVNQVITTLKGLYHETNSYITVNIGEGSQTRKKKQPMILCLFADTALIRKGDYITIGGKEYKVSGVTNVQNWDIFGDVSLEVIDDGI